MKNATKKIKNDYDPLDREFDLSKVKLTAHTPRTTTKSKINHLLSAIKEDYNFDDKDFYNGLKNYIKKYDKQLA